MMQEQKVNVRNIALDVLIRVMEQGELSDRALHSVLEKHRDMDKRDRAFLTRLCEGTIEYAINLDYVINLYSGTKVRKMKPVIRNIIRMGAYQILYMEHVPDSAACNESVKLAVKRKFGGLKGFVNGVLRSVSREKENIKYPDRDKDFVKFASVAYSMPEWIVERFTDSYGREVSEEILRSFLKNSSYTTVRCNTSKTDIDSVVSSLENQGVSVVKSDICEQALKIKDYDRLNELECFRKGFVQVQDQSSMLVGQSLGITGGEKIIDICAAPGGKTLHAADLLRGSGIVISCDINDTKVSLIRDNVARNGFENVTAVVNDALVFRQEWENSADIMIADLPCSGLGVMGKKCDIKYKTTEEDIKNLSNIQRDILKVAVKYLKSGGRMIFSTCTIAPEENEKNVEWILNNLDVEEKSLREYIPEKLRKYIKEDNYLQVLPNMADTDGFFLASFVKK